VFRHPSVEGASFHVESVRHDDSSASGVEGSGCGVLGVEFCGSPCGEVGGEFHRCGVFCDLVGLESSGHRADSISDMIEA
jgi:hypothetical protein